MAQQTTDLKRNRFVHHDELQCQDKNVSPIWGYQYVPVQKLEEAMKDIIFSNLDIKKEYVNLANEKYKKDTKLTSDESAAIYLYTMPTPVHIKLNDALRTEDPSALKIWLPYLKLLITALNKLPSLAKTTVWRGVQAGISFDFESNPVQRWWSINSCSKSLKVIEAYLNASGTFFAIETVYGKDISQYSAIPHEEEVILMPGTRVRLQCPPLDIQNRPYTVSFVECPIVPEGKHVMLSCHPNDQKLVSKIGEALENQHFQVWFNQQGGLYNIRDSLAEGVNNAAVFCCFLTPEYEQSVEYQIELQYATQKSVKIIPCILENPEIWKYSEWLLSIIDGLENVPFYVFEDPSDINEIIDWLFYYMKRETSLCMQLSSNKVNKSCYLFEIIKYEYQRNNRLYRLINPSQSFSIEQSYINLVIVNAKDQREKEKQLHDAKHGDVSMGNYEDIYGVKIKIDVKDILQSCKGEKKQVLVFGRAGIGKSTFCRYLAYQWARGSYWSHYELVAMIPLRRLTADLYPSNKTYSLIDLVKKEVFSFELSKKEEQIFEEHFDAKKTLWVLDGYDEIRGNIPPHLGSLFEHLLNTPHHILTSRPYLNTLSYEVQMEITGFTDKNIEEYVHQFFNQMETNSEYETIKKDALLKFLKSNRTLWSIAHIPVNLELICSAWSNRDLLETRNLTITTLYTTLTEWLCRRYLKAQNHDIQILSEEEVYEHCQKELTFLESLAFHAMDTNTIIIRPLLLKKVLEETKLTSQDYLKILKIGLLKSFSKETTGVQLELKKDHYFIHLSFQEYFAARYLIRALNQPSTQATTKVFINCQKYNQRYALVFNFMAGILGETYPTSCIQTFWNILLGKPLDIVGIRHMQLIISCMDATSDYSTVPYHTELLEWIAECIHYHIVQANESILKHIIRSLITAESITNDDIIINMFILLLENNDIAVKQQTLLVLSQLNISHRLDELISLVTTCLNHEDTYVKRCACGALGNMGEKAATNEVIKQLVSALSDQDDRVKKRACEALGNMGERAATNEVIKQLVSALGYEEYNVRAYACEALVKMGEKAARNEVVKQLVSVLGDQNYLVRANACQALGKMGQKAATNEMIKELVSALGDEDCNLRASACEALGQMGEKAATNEVIKQLVSALGDQNDSVRATACEALANMGEKAATQEVIKELVSALGDQDDWVRQCACRALGNMGEKAATNEVIKQLPSALGDEDYNVRAYACEALGNMGEKAATNEVIKQLVSAVGDQDYHVRANACRALENMGEKAATNEVIKQLVGVLGDQNYLVRACACAALGKMGEKAATNEVIKQLVGVLGDQDYVVRAMACQALGEMGEKAATNEVIKQLVSALGDRDDCVRENACKSLGNMGEKAATSEVIQQLVSIVGGQDDNVIKRACRVLVNMGEKAATNEVITMLLTKIRNHYWTVFEEDKIIIRTLLTTPSVLVQLDSKYILDFYLSKPKLDIFGIMSLDEWVNRVVIATDVSWRCVLTHCALLRGAAIVLRDNKLMIYDGNEPTEMSNVNSASRSDINEAFSVQKMELHLSFMNTS